jgi:membrane-bound hydrogenase subunit alpha
VIQDTLEEMTGNRVNYGINTIGGVRRDLTPAQVKDALARLPMLEDRMMKYVKMINSQETVLIRFRGIGKLSKEEALKYGTVGPTARASGVEYDVRRDQPYIAYKEIPWNVATSTSGDVYGRTIVRIIELQESLGIVKKCLEGLPEGAIRVDSPKTAPATEVLSRYEAPRGELAHFIRTNNTDKVERVDIRTPTLANWTSVAVSLVGQNLADIPVIVAAIDPCLSCTSRITVVNEKGRTTGEMSFEQLRKHAEEFYRERGRT